MHLKNNNLTDVSAHTLLDQTRQRLAHFLDWWFTGLAIPWARRSSAPIVITIDSEKEGSSISELTLNPQGAIDCVGLNTLQLEKLARNSSDEGIYLFVPSDKVIVTKIDQAQRNLHPLDIALESLPFARDEIVATVSADQQQLYCVLKRDINPLMESAKVWEDATGNGIGLGFAGIAFVGASTWLCIDTQTPMNSGSKKPKQRLLVGFFAALVFVLGTMLVATYYAQNQRRVLQAEMSALPFLSSEGFDGVPAMASLQHALERPGSRSAERTIALLNVLLDALGPDVEISQLIFSANELLIDASADSATRLQLALASSGEFSGLEFVAGISTDAASDKERFRLKLDVSEPAEEVGGKVGTGDGGL